MKRGRFRSLLRVALTTALVVALASIANASSASAHDVAGARPGPPRSAATSIAPGYSHTCVLLESGQVTCWGDGGYGQLGTGTPISNPGETVDFGAGRTATAVASGANHSCALLDNGQVSCWAYNLEGQLGNGTTTGSATPTPVALPAERVAISITAGWGHTCVLLDDGRISCWGRNNDGQLGDGTPSSYRTTPSPPITLPAGHTAVAVTVGRSHSCALLNDGRVSCWGRAESGKLGDGTTSGIRATPSPPITFPGGRSAVAITAGAEHTCAILDQGLVTCWGGNYDGQLGDGTTVSRAIPPNPIAMPGGRAATAISAGSEYTCALLDNGAITCWGSNDAGQHGDGTTITYRNTPTAPISLPGGAAVAVAGGLHHTCAVLHDQSVTCWGLNDKGQLGTGTTVNRLAPGPSVTGLTSVAAVDSAVSAGYLHTCALTAAQSVTCWGSGDNGQLGRGNTTAHAVPPSPITIGVGGAATSVRSGTGHSCALTSSGAIACWGDNAYGQLGTGSTLDTYIPIAVVLPTGRRATRLSTGSYHNCAVLDNGSIACWGAIAGVGVVATPTLVSLPTGWKATDIAAGGSFTCALFDGGSVACWGSDVDGQLGNGATTGTTTKPTSSIILPDGFTATAVTAGDGHACAILTDRSVSCWGSDSAGQLGNGMPLTSISSPMPRVQLGAIAIDAGAAHTCVARGAAGYACWGMNAAGQLGNGSIGGSQPSPQSQPTPTYAITTGGFHTCGVDVGNRVFCWGGDAAGQLGDGGTNLEQATPSPVALSGTLRLRLPATTPAAPGVPAAVAQSDQVQLSWSGPVDDGGASIQHYVVESSRDNGGSWGAPIESTTGAQRTLTLAQLPAGTYRFRVAAVNTIGRGVWSPPSPAVTTVPPTGGGGGGSATGLATIAPSRLVDTRPAGITIDHKHQNTGTLKAGTTREYKIAGRGGIPNNATAAILNLAIVNPTAPGHATIYPCGTKPNAANINYTNTTIANTTIAKLSSTGTICIHTHATTHLVIDANGYNP